MDRHLRGMTDTIWYTTYIPRMQGLFWPPDPGGCYTAGRKLARAPARLRRASRLCSHRLGGPWPRAGAALRRGRASVASRRGESATGAFTPPNFAARRADFAHGAKRREPRDR